MVLILKKNENRQTFWQNLVYLQCFLQIFRVSQHQWFSGEQVFNILNKSKIIIIQLLVKNGWRLAMLNVKCGIARKLDSSYTVDSFGKQKAWKAIVK